MLQGATEVALTNLDVLGYLDEIPICTAYEIHGERTTSFPVPEQLGYAQPVIEAVPGWKCDISSIRRFDELPQAEQAYIRLLEQLIQVPIRWVSNGPNREQLMERTCSLP